MGKIEIITGKIRVGKTTYLNNRLLNGVKIKGILQPVINGERFFVDVESDEKRQISTKTENNGTFRLGKYVFYNSAFEWARYRLESILLKDFETIVIDEYGPLEFENNGLEPIVSKIISVILRSSNQKLIIVIRESLVDRFIQRYNLLAEDVKITEVKI